MPMIDAMNKGVFTTGGAFSNQFHTDIIHKNRARNDTRRREALASKTRIYIGEWIIDGDTNLHIAVRGGDTREVGWILKHCDVSGNDLDTALRTAVYYDSIGTGLQCVKIPIIKMLLRSGADIMFMDTCLQTTLSEAVRYEPDVIQALLENGCKPRTLEDPHTCLSRYIDGDISGMTSCSPLVEAVHCRNIPVVKLLLRLDADVTARNVDGNTAIHDAVGGHTGREVAELLLTHCRDFARAPQTTRRVPEGCFNAEVDKLLRITNNEGRTALHVAAEYGGDAIVRLLLCNGADKRLLDNDAQTPIDLAITARAGWRGGMEEEARELDKVIRTLTTFDR